MALVKSLAKRGHFNKWFDRQAAHKTVELYQQQFGVCVSRRCVRALDVSHVLWVESEAGVTAGAMMLSRTGIEPVYRVQGLAVSQDFQPQGYGTTLLASVDGFVGPGATVWLCVDKGRDSTDWLVRWYTRMGFELAYTDPSLQYQTHEIPLKKLVK